MPTAFPILAPLAALVLAACVPGAGTATNPHTGVTAHRSSEVALDRTPASTFHARAVVLERQGVARYAILTRVVRADGNYPKIEGAWSFGTGLPYVKGDRRRVGCGTATGCRREEVGSLPLSRPAFEAGARTGLTLHLIGRRGSYTGHLPGAAFSDVLARLGDRPVDKTVHATTRLTGTDMP